MIHPGNQLLRVVSRQEKKLHIYLESWEHDLEYFLAWNNSAKIENVAKSYYGLKLTPPWKSVIKILASEIQ